MFHLRLLLGLSFFQLWLCCGAEFACAQETAWSSDQIAFFETKIRPVLSEHCFECHSAKSDKLKGGLMLDSRARMLKGGETGPSINLSRPLDSLLLAAVRYESVEMPPKGKLPNEHLDVLTRWVEMGAPWPTEPEPTPSSSTQRAFDLASRKESHWSWKPVLDSRIPAVNDAGWPKQPLDFFVLSKLESNGLKPSPSADRRIFVRRLAYALTGLPPNPEQVNAFVDNQSPLAFEELIDAMLQSQAYGEHWGRHWLDLVRYAESRGHEFDPDIPNAYQYRDYVIRALNADVAFDQFLLEHIAGDLIEEPRRNPNSGFNESILGTGFWYLGEWLHSPVDIRKEETDRFDNMIDVMSKTFVGLTVSCARCHDHKFDAISTRDYYAISGFLQGSQYRQVRFDTILAEKEASHRLSILDRDFRKRLRSLLGVIWTSHRVELLAQVAATQGDLSQSIELACRLPTLAPKGTLSKVVVDYSQDDEPSFVQDGVIFGDSVRRRGEVSLSSVGNPTPVTPQFELIGTAKNDPIWNGLVSISEQPTNLKSKLESSQRSGRTLLSPSFELEYGHVSCLIRGAGQIFACVDSHRLVQGPLHGETVRDVDSRGTYQWVSLNLSRYLGHRVHLEFTPAEDKSLEIIGVTDGKEPESSVAFHESQAATPSQIAAFDMAMSRLSDDTDVGSLPPSTIAPWNWFLRNYGKLLEAHPGDKSQLQTEISQWHEARARIRSQVPNESRLAPAMMDGMGEDDRVLIRGNSSTPGDVVPRRFLQALDGDAPLCQGTESGRLQLAMRMNAPNNPLTSRVIVNRVWHHLFGRGIVPSVDDFGVLGQPPTHPELLDHLVHEFEQNGKSIKRLIKYITSSQAYQMGNQASPAALSADPLNAWLHHFSPRRLSGEAIRDSLLVLSGDIKLQPFGPAIPIHLTEFMDGRGKPPKSGPLHGEHRRSIYVAVRRNFLSPFLLTFDTPNPFSTMGRRNQSNVPAQALILMNDPFVREQTKSWANRMLQSPASSNRERVDMMYRMAFARPATDQELETSERFLREQCNLQGGNESDAGVWSEFAHALVNLKEFVFIR
jgi:hypothetical protein